MKLDRLARSVPDGEENDPPTVVWPMIFALILGALALLSGGIHSDHVSISFQVVSDAEAEWTASNRYWRKCGYLILAVAVIVPFFVADEEVGLQEGLLISAGFVIPPVLWMRRLAAWEADDALVIRSWFTTKRRSWQDVDRLCLIERNWGTTSWVTAAVRHGRKRTYLNSMVAVSAAGVAQLIEELEVLARRHGLGIDEPPEALFRKVDAGIRGIRPFD